MRDMFGESMGYWNINIDGANFDLKPKVNDLKVLRNIMFDKTNRSDMTRLMDKFDQFMFDLIKRDYPEQQDERIREFVVMNSLKLFRQAQIQFKFTTEEQLKKAEKDAETQSKNLIENV